MIIDVHVFPGFIKEICESEERVAYRREEYFLYKQHVWPLSLLLIQMDAAGVEKSVIAAEDVTTKSGDTIVSNEEVKKLVELQPERLIGFAGVDPKRDDAEAVLSNAFENLNLKGLKLSPAMQNFYPMSEEAQRLYEICIYANKPIIFEAGMTWVKNSPTKYSHPILFEEVAIRYPELRFCLSHFGWPWTREVAMLLLKYPNVYADTGLLYFDSPKQFFDTEFKNNLGEYWIDRMLYDKVMFGSTYPRIEQKRMVGALESLTLREEQLRMIKRDNAKAFLGEDVING